jgi:hypothetical protein
MVTNLTPALNDLKPGQVRAASIDERGDPRHTHRST